MKSPRLRADDHPTGYSSRRTSWSSDGASRTSRNYSGDPFADSSDPSRAPSRAGSDDGELNTQTVSEKYNILPSAGLLLFPEDVEKDDYLHNPGPDDVDRECDIWNKRSLVNVGGLAFVTLGLLMLMVLYPVVYVISRPLTKISSTNLFPERWYGSSPHTPILV